MSTNTLSHQVNTPAPDFTLTSHQGDPLTLSAYMGEKNVVLFFVRTYSCYSCRQHVEHLARSYGEFKNRDAEVLVILNADAANAKNYANVTRAPFPVLADPYHTIYNLYGLNTVFLLSTRTGSVIINKQGIVSYLRSLTNPWGWRNETETLLDQLATLQNVAVTS